MEEGAAAGTIRREWQVLTRILNLAVRDEKLDRNPLKHVDLAEAEELEALRTIKEKDPSKRECRQELWQIIQVALNMGLREGEILAIERSWIKKREDGYWLCLPPASSRIKGNPKEVPLNRIALRALHDSPASIADGQVFRHWTDARAFKGYWLETVRRVGIQSLRFHDLRHTFTTPFRVFIARLLWRIIVGGETIKPQNEATAGLPLPR
jgi:integrase